MRKLRCVGICILFFVALFSSLSFAASLRVSWNATPAADLDGYNVYYGTRSGVYTNVATVRNATSYIISNVQNGYTYYVAVTSFDLSGNESVRSTEISAYVPAVVQPTDTTPPTGSLLINTGAETTSSTTVTLSLYFSDAGGAVTAMKFSNDGINYTDETSVAPSIIWTLSSGYGAKTVYVLFKDAAGNWMNSPATASIFLVSSPVPGPEAAASFVEAVAAPADTTPAQSDDANARTVPDDISGIKPEIISPENNQIEVPLRPMLKTTSLAEDYPQVQWEISNDDGEVLLDLTTARYRTGLLVPEMVLSVGMKHYCRVRYLAADGTASEWSDPVAFTTVQYDSADMNMNGIPDDQELIVSEEIDLDMNGVYDRMQADIKSLLTLVGGEYVSLQMLTNCRAISAFKSIDPSTIEDTQGKPYDLPFGLIDFRAEVDRPGDFAEVVVYLSQPAPPGAKWYMYDEASGWRVYPHAAFSEDRMNVTVRLKDGDREYGDADGVANGIIIDPSGLGVGGDSEGSMCFITATTVDDSPFSLWAAMLLVLMVLVMTGKRSRPRGRQ